MRRVNGRLNVISCKLAPDLYYYRDLLICCLEMPFFDDPML